MIGLVGMPRLRSFWRLPLIEKVAYGLSRRKAHRPFRVNWNTYRGERRMSARKRIPGISRRTLLKAGAVISAYPAPHLLAQTPEPLKIGFLTVLTGPLAAGGQQQQEGAALFLEERNGMIAGRKVELITQDTGGNPALAKTKTQELVERYNVPVMIGPLATNEAIAMDGYIRETKVPLITTTSAATVDLKSHAVNPWVLHAF